jgi:hypothetical protein
MEVTARNIGQLCAALELTAQGKPHRERSQRDHHDRPEANREKLVGAIGFLPLGGCGAVPVMAFILRDHADPREEHPVHRY